MTEGINKNNHVFTDRHGVEWDTTITLIEAWRVDAAEFDGVTDVEVMFTKPDDDMIREIMDNSQLMYSVMYVIIEKQAKERDVSYEEFCGGIDGDCMWPSTLALLEALKDFFPSARTVLSPMTKAIKKVLAEQEAGALATEQEVTDLLDKLMSQAKTEANQKREAAREKLGI